MTKPGANSKRQKIYWSRLVDGWVIAGQPEIEYSSAILGDDQQVIAIVKLSLFEHDEHGFHPLRIDINFKIGPTITMHRWTAVKCDVALYTEEEWTDFSRSIFLVAEQLIFKDKEQLEKSAAATRTVKSMLH